jgi:hypothetical protein
VKAALGPILIAAVIAGCGGGGGNQTASAPAPATSTPQAATPPTSPSPTATTNTPPTKHRTKPQPLEDSGSTRPLHVGPAYTCNGKPLKGIQAAGPVKITPAVVKPGQSFAVTVTDPSAKVALVSLAGVAPRPIQSNATEQGGKLTATLKMPGYATCGNKLVEVEGDVSAEAYVGVGKSD